MAKNSLDKQIKSIFDELLKRKATVEADEAKIKRSWKTTCSLILDGNTPPINIQVASEDKLIDTYAAMLIQQDYRLKASEELGVEFDGMVDGIVCGFHIDDWVMDFKKRIAAIHIKSKKRKLSELETRLEAIVSPEQRREMELEAIMKELD